MKPCLMLLGALTVPLTAADARSSRTSITLVATVPVSCSVDLLNRSIADRHMVLDIRRTCNTGHRIVLAGRSASDLGPITARYNDSVAISSSSESQTFEQAERYYDQVDRLVVEAGRGSPEDFRNYATSLSVSIETS